MAFTYPIRFAAQMREHLRALRKKHGLTQAQLGAQMGVSQARIAEIEANPGLVSFEQLLQVLSHLDSGVLIEEHEQHIHPESLDEELSALCDDELLADDSGDEDVAEHLEMLQQAIDDVEESLDEDAPGSADEPARGIGHYAFRKKQGSW